MRLTRWKNMSRENIFDRSVAAIFISIMAVISALVWKIEAKESVFAAGIAIICVFIFSLVVLKLAMLFWEPVPTVPVDTESADKEKKQMLKDGHCSCRDTPPAANL